MVMIRPFQIAVFALLFLCLVGCNAPEEEEPVWERVKFRDLASSGDQGQQDRRPLKTINFNVYVFEIPAGSIGVLDEVWEALYPGPLRFKDYDAFNANSFSAGFGQRRAVSRVVELLQSVGGRRVQMVSLLLPDGQFNDVVAGGLPAEQTIFYAATGGGMQGVSVGPGRLVLRISAERIPRFKGLCSVRVQPAFVSGVRRPVPGLGGAAGAEEFVFGSTGFGLKMAAGDFFFLGPRSYVKDPMALAGHFFSRPSPGAVGRMLLVPPSEEGGNPQPYYGPVVRTYMVLCAGTND
ncbi:MAG: hypothetical protein ACYTEQ_15135 [Planctomycetota bacterium]|jgi:hypothetical protein